MSPSYPHQIEAARERGHDSFLKSGTTLNRFEAERIGDHCLHSTISGLRNKGHKIGDEWELVPTRFGKVHVKRYAYIGCGHGEI